MRGDGDPLYYKALEWVEWALLWLVGWGRRRSYTPGEVVRVRNANEDGALDRRGSFLGVVRSPFDPPHWYHVDLYWDDGQYAAHVMPARHVADMRPYMPTEDELALILEHEIAR